MDRLDESAASVKSLANKLIKDHTAANNELMSTIKKKQVMAAADDKAATDSWRHETGPAFDSACIDRVIAAHEKAIALFEEEAKYSGDAQLKAWARKKLPTLREQLKLAQDIRTKLPITK